MPLFAVFRTRGTAWKTDGGPDEQEAYPAHAEWVRRLHEQGVVVLGGWLGDMGDVLLIMRGASPSDVWGRLQEDPWTGLEVLPVSRVEAWSLGIGTLPGEY